LPPALVSSSGLALFRDGEATMASWAKVARPLTHATRGLAKLGLAWPSLCLAWAASSVQSAVCNPTDNCAPGKVGLELPDVELHDKSTVGSLYLTSQRVVWVSDAVANATPTVDTAFVPLAAVVQVVPRLSPLSTSLTLPPHTPCTSAYVQVTPHRWALFASKTPRVKLEINVDAAAVPTAHPLHSVRTACLTLAFRYPLNPQRSDRGQAQMFGVPVQIVEAEAAGAPSIKS
jgi:hypothetical protein